MKKILHITNWYPNTWDDLEGIFIKKQFDLFKDITDSQIVNVQVREGKKLFEFKYFKYSENEEGYFILTKIKSSKIKETLTTLLLLYVLFKKKYKQFDFLHFHIAYPLLTHYYLWKKFIKVPVIISEHWSAYHFNFYMPKNTKKLNGIKRIFKQNIPIITVSKALLKDIEEFSGVKQEKYLILPNVIDKIFNKNLKVENKYPSFFIVNIWREIKNPFPILKAFSSLSKKGFKFQLKIGGYGELLLNMKKFVKQHNLESKITFLGKMNSREIEEELNRCDAYLFSSKYETFSVACADALTLGSPLIGYKIPSILEYTDKKDIVIVKSDDAISWEKSILYFINNKEKYNKELIAQRVFKYLSAKRVIKLYEDFINEIT